MDINVRIVVHNRFGPKTRPIKVGTQIKFLSLKYRVYTVNLPPIPLTKPCVGFSAFALNFLPAFSLVVEYCKYQKIFRARMPKVGRKI
jgi:hypothetical protein